MKPKVALLLAVWALVMGAMAGTPSVSAHGPGDWHQAVAHQSAAQPSAAQRCSEYHKFGGQPVDVAKSADNSRVLARVLWGYSAEWGFCYLVLDDSATETLRASAGQLADPSPDDADPAAAARCSRHHRFGGQPVDVAKTADNSRTLAQAHWNYNAQHNICYLTLNPAATEALRNPPPTTPPDDTDDDTDPPSTPGTALNITAIPRYKQITVTWTAPDSTESPPGTGYVVAYKANATACPTDIDVREITWVATNEAHFSHLTWDYINTPNTEVTIPAPSIDTPYLVCVASISPIADGTWATATSTPSAVDPDRSRRFLATRGEIVVKTHVCAAPDLAQLIEPSYISRTVELWNNLEAPFYFWQSSGLLTMRMESGQIIESRILQEKSSSEWDSRKEVAPSDCTGRVQELENTIHHFLVLQHQSFGGLGGRGRAGTFLSAYFIQELIEEGQLDSESFSAMARRHFATTSHELDHGLGIPHINGREKGLTRGQVHPETESKFVIGSFAGQPSNLALAYSQFRSDLRVAYLCYDIRDLGWPMGHGEPACVRAHPPERSDLDVQTTADRAIRVSWSENSIWPRNDEPVTGYRIELEQLKAQEEGELEWTLVSSYDLDASTTSFVTPPQPFGRYQVKLLQSWALEDGFFLEHSREYFNHYLTVVGPTIAAVQRPNLNTTSGSVRNPIEYELKWEPAPGASYYQVSGFENCSYEPVSQEEWFALPDTGFYRASGCYKETAEPEFFLSEAMYQIQEGETYEILIAACYPDYNDCHIWTTATINAQRFGSDANLRIYPEVLHGKPGYFFVWEHIPEASRYLLYIGECLDNWSGCIPSSRILLTDGPNANIFLQMGEGILDYGKRYLVELEYCPPGVDGWVCIPWTKTTFTTQARDN